MDNSETLIRTELDTTTLLAHPDSSDATKIANLAHSYWLQRGSPQGSPNDDWYRAVKDLAS
jgi:Protein of unknown function (DUF2934)